jgi:hypothetical protein
MKKITKKAVYGRLPISLSLYCVQPEREIYETDIKSAFYKGFEVEYVEHLNLDKSHIGYIVKKVNGFKVKIHHLETRKHIDQEIERVFEKINGNKQCCLDDVFFTKESYIERMKNEDLEETARRLLINARYNGKQFNWCFEYLYKKGLSIPVLASFL